MGRWNLMNMVVAVQTVTSATIMNNTSSRSHAVFVLKVQRIRQRNEDGSRESTNAKINLVDLAGSERHKASDYNGHTFKEGCAINQSLSALALVIKELGEQQQSRVMRQRSRSMSIDKTGGVGPAAPAPGALLEVKEEEDDEKDVKL
ncbi:KIN4A [Symbiodinium pilosum]|uniref:KIN4A protein n=1 Tax=Symbiodinium pilosum TaxID=2952 RepID=A0A812Q1Q7_SYMPI|nr:KIN4A [Symbiodinium pilosum]